MESLEKLTRSTENSKGVAKSQSKRDDSRRLCSVFLMSSRSSSGGESHSAQLFFLSNVKRLRLLRICARISVGRAKRVGGAMV